MCMERQRWWILSVKRGHFKWNSILTRLNNNVKGNIFGVVLKKFQKKSTVWLIVFLKGEMDSDFVSVSVNGYTDTTAIVFTEKECFICREAEKTGQEELHNYCDCRDLVGHHQCLLTWIQKGSGNEDRQRCSACTAQYHLQEGTIWKSLICQWRSLLAFIVTLTSIIAIPFLIRYLNKLTDPPPNQLFKIMAVCSGVIAETLLIRCFLWYYNNQYIKARLSSFSIKARSLEEQGRVGLQSPMAQSSLTIVVNRAETEKQTAVIPKDTLRLKLSV